MKKFILPSLVVLLAACNSDDGKVLVKGAASKEAPAVIKVKGPYQPVVRTGIEGYYTGMFGEDYGKMITLRIDSVNENRVSGCSVSWGLMRPVKGQLQKDGATWRGTLAEPGDDKYDGIFHFSYDPATKKLSGNWEPYNPKSTDAKEFSLERRTFRYDPDLPLEEQILHPLESTYNEKTNKGEVVTTDALKFNASAVALKPKDIENMYLTDLEVLRNSIYARHGYSFRNAKMREVFDGGVSWYMPVSVDVTAELTPLEQQNIALIKRYEKHATKYYDTFGR